MITEVLNQLEVFAQAIGTQSEDFLERLFDYTSENVLETEVQRIAYREGALAILANVEGLDEAEEHEAALKEALIEIDPAEFEELRSAHNE